jgi:hypothetical protein
LLQIWDRHELFIMKYWFWKRSVRVWCHWWHFVSIHSLTYNPISVENMLTDLLQIASHCQNVNLNVPSHIISFTFVTTLGWTCLMSGRQVPHRICFVRAGMLQPPTPSHCSRKVWGTDSLMICFYSIQFTDKSWSYCYCLYERLKGKVECGGAVSSAPRLIFHSLKVWLVSFNAFMGAVGVPKQGCLSSSRSFISEALGTDSRVNFLITTCLDFAVLDLHRFVENREGRTSIKKIGDRKSSKVKSKIGFTGGFGWRGWKVWSFELCDSTNQQRQR